MEVVWSGESPTCVCSMEPLPIIFICVCVGVCTCVVVGMFSLHRVIRSVWFRVGGAVCSIGMYRRLQCHWTTHTITVCVCICCLYVLCARVWCTCMCVGDVHPATICMCAHTHALVHVVV